ncbi:MAG: hypothetical protein WAL29_00760 [Bacteroidales bacterium]
MKLLKQYWLVLAILALVSAALLVRTFSCGNFKYDAEKLAEPSALRTNILQGDQIPALKGEIMTIDLQNIGPNNSPVIKSSLKVDPDSILDRKYLDLIRKHKGPVILAGSDNSVSARIWMVLSQMGIKNLFILSKDSDPEVLKKEFRPDSLSGPEL